MMPPEDALYRGKKLADMTREELIAALNAVASLTRPPAGGWPAIGELTARNIGIRP